MNPHLENARKVIEERRRAAFELGLNIGIIAGFATGVIITYLLLTDVFN